MKYVFLLFILTINIFANNVTIEKKIKELKKPLYTPFVENYILNELKQLRDENRDLKIDLHKTLAKKEIEMSSNVVNYATSTINNMFYIIAAASSILVIIGWTSIREINEKIRNMIDNKTSKIIKKYEEKMAVFEKDLEKRATQVKRNEEKIEKMNTVHSLWIRASQDQTPTGKIEAYDEILELRPNDVEALVYKAEAVLELEEANWSLNLTNQALLIDKNYASAYYQRAKAFSVLGYEESAVSDLEKAISLNEEYILELENIKEFKSIQNNSIIKKLVDQKRAS